MHITGTRLAAFWLNLVLAASYPGVVPGVENQSVTIGTGGTSGIYYPAGGTICRLFNRTQTEHGIDCTAHSTDGSVYNLNALRTGKLNMAIVQSDWQYHAYTGTSEFKQVGAARNLRSVFSLHDEPFTVVARKSSGIKTFDDLKGKRVNIGNPGSGQRATMEVLMAAKGWSRNDFAIASELKPSDQAQAMCDNEIDAIVYIAGHPNQSILEATIACDSLLVPVTGPEVDRLVRNNAYYIHAVIPGGMYRNNPDDIKTFGVKATVVTTSELPEQTIYWVVKSVFDNLDEFRSINLALSGLNPKAMVEDGNSAPLHPGALRYFREVGLVPPPGASQ